MENYEQNKASEIKRHPDGSINMFETETATHLIRLEMKIGMLQADIDLIKKFILGLPMQVSNISSNVNHASVNVTATSLDIKHIKHSVDVIQQKLIDIKHKQD